MYQQEKKIAKTIYSGLYEVFLFCKAHSNIVPYDKRKIIDQKNE